jgi:hypothetical protein
MLLDVGLSVHSRKVVKKIEEVGKVGTAASGCVSSHLDEMKEVLVVPAEDSLTLLCMQLGTELSDRNLGKSGYCGQGVSSGIASLAALIAAYGGHDLEIGAKLH